MHLLMGDFPIPETDHGSPRCCQRHRPRRGPPPKQGRPSAPRPNSAVSESFRSVSYIVCRVDLTKDDLRIFWRGPDGKPYRTFASVAADLQSKGRSLQFAMNGGMYQDDFRPVGLYIENGREVTPNQYREDHRPP